MKEVTQTIEVNAPASECYRMWSSFYNFPKFMKNIESITPKTEAQEEPAAAIWHWKAKGPFDRTVEWDAKWDQAEPNRFISWHSVNREKNDINLSGNVRFSELGPEQTEVTVCIELDIPAGRVGGAIARLFGDPERKVREDLQSFKDLIEKEARRQQSGNGN